MKKSATDIIDQYTDNGTLQHGQSQFLGTYYNVSGINRQIIVQYSNIEGIIYPFTNILSNKGVIVNDGKGNAILRFEVKDLPININVEDPKGFLHWSAGNPDNIISQDATLVLSEELWKNLDGAPVFAIIDKKIN